MNAGLSGLSLNGGRPAGVISQRGGQLLVDLLLK